MLSEINFEITLCKIGIGGKRYKLSVQRTEKASTQELKGSGNLEKNFSNLKFNLEAKQYTFKGKEMFSASNSKKIEIKSMSAQNFLI